MQRGCTGLPLRSGRWGTCGGTTASKWMAWWRKVGMESAHGGSLQRVTVARRNRVGGHRASSLSQASSIAFSLPTINMML